MVLIHIYLFDADLYIIYQWLESKQYTKTLAFM